MEKVNTVAQCASELPVNEFEKWLDVLEARFHEELSETKSLSIKEDLYKRLGAIYNARLLTQRFYWEKNSS